ncbi:XRE family transcriptional regulator [Enterovibrio makurazakiensis]|uniref:helix-turn-helix domain-containing protein n=1 Tax=Enterovibrio makurazakiensis TaxID=2910232 RepID=UPI003D2499C1
MDYFCFEKINNLPAPMHLDFDNEGVAQQIGKNLVRYRRTTGAKQQSMADAFGVSIAQYRKYEKGVDVAKMHSVARWSIVTGSPNNLLLCGTEYSPYLNISSSCWEMAPFYCTVSHASDATFNSLCLLSQEITKSTITPIVSSGLVPDLSDVLLDIELNYYVKVAKNMMLIRDHLGLSQERLAEFLGISDKTYRQYEKPCNHPRIPFTFFARSHAALQLDNRWSETGTSDFSIFNRRRNNRLSMLSPIIRGANEAQKASLSQMFNAVSQELIEIQLEKELANYQSMGTSL